MTVSNILSACRVGLRSYSMLFAVFSIRLSSLCVLFIRASGGLAERCEPSTRKRRIFIGVSVDGSAVCFC